MFFYPMWVSESQRIGKQKCTPWGYRLHGIAKIIGFCGLLVFIGVPVFLMNRPPDKSFIGALIDLLLISVLLDIIGKALFRFSWYLASRRGFTYDYDLHEASWIENGERVTYRYDSGHHDGSP